MSEQVETGGHDLKQMSLSEIKVVSFEILKYFASFCKENNIQYYLSNGSLLGAVKYKGFIPWDDDIDVLVPRNDYDRLLGIFPLNDKYKLFSSSSDRKFQYTFAKLCDMTTLRVEGTINEKIRLGLHIDILPLDSCSKHIFCKNTQRKMRFYQVGCVLSKFNLTQKKSLLKRCAIAGFHVLGYEFFSKRLKKLVNRETAMGNEYIGCLNWPIYGEREFLPAEVFSDTVFVTFEGIDFPAPIGYDAYLKSLYGDYHLDPPIECQKTHHSYSAYEI